jgi:hypothetical protein
LGTVRPRFDSCPILKIITPVSFILGSVYMNINTVAVRFVLFPLSFINISICMPEFTLAICFIEAPFALVLGSIRPYLSTWTMSGSVFEVAFVDRSVFKNQFFNKLISFFLCLTLEVC